MEFFEKAVSKSKEYAKVVEQKAGEAYDIAKTRYKIMELKNQISRRYEDIGRAVYARERGEPQDDECPEVENLLGELDLMNAELENLRKSLAELKGERICAQCKANICKEDAYCRFCGASTDA